MAPGLHLYLIVMKITEVGKKRMWLILVASILLTSVGLSSSLTWAKGKNDLYGGWINCLSAFDRLPDFRGDSHSIIAGSFSTNRRLFLTYESIPKPGIIAVSKSGVYHAEIPSSIVRSVIDFQGTYKKIQMLNEEIIQAKQDLDKMMARAKPWHDEYERLMSLYQSGDSRANGFTRRMQYDQANYYRRVADQIVFNASENHGKILHLNQPKIRELREQLANHRIYRISLDALFPVSSELGFSERPVVLGLELQLESPYSSNFNPVPTLDVKFGRAHAESPTTLSFERFGADAHVSALLGQYVNSALERFLAGVPTASEVERVVRACENIPHSSSARENIMKLLVNDHYDVSGQGLDESSGDGQRAY
jgi:hypothetical protein